MTSPGERIAANTIAIRGLSDDLHELKDETLRTRNRLHKLEGLVWSLVEQEKIRRRVTGERQRSLELRIQALTVVVGVAAVSTPFLYHLAGVS